MNDIKVSVIIPVYNAERYLKKCLESVINQTLKEIEIICVDDGSTDSSVSILNEYAKKDSRITVLTQQNLFAGAARNNGMSRAGGKYYAFWDSDDYFEPDALETLYGKCEKENADICLCAAYTFDDGSDKKSIDEAILKRRFLPKESVFSIETHPQYIFNMASNVPWQRLFRADFIKEHSLQFQNLRHANDTYFVLTATYYAKRITYTQKPLINYRTNNSSSVTGKASADPLCAYKAYKAVYDKITAEGISETALQSFYNRLYNGLIRSILLQNEEASMNAVYDKIKNEGFEYFKIDEHIAEDYCYFKGDREDMLFIKEHTLCEFLMFKYRKENADRQFYKRNAEKTLKIRLARKISSLVPADSRLYDIGKKILKFK